MILLYVGFGAVLLRRKITSYWRYFHGFMYLALFFGVVHANLLGIDFQNIYIPILYDVLFAAALFAFCLKRWQFYRIKRRNHKSNAVHQNNQA